MVLDQNIFIEQLLPGSVTTGLGDSELAVYRGYYPTEAKGIEERQKQRELQRPVSPENRPIPRSMAAR